MKDIEQINKKHWAINKNLWNIKKANKNHVVSNPKHRKSLKNIIKIKLNRKTWNKQWEHIGVIDIEFAGPLAYGVENSIPLGHMWA